MTVIFIMLLFIPQIWIESLPGVKHHDRSWDLVETRLVLVFHHGVYQGHREASYIYIYTHVYVYSNTALMGRSTQIWRNTDTHIELNICEMLF